MMAYFFSAKQAWQRPFFRWGAILALACVFAGSGYFLWKVWPAHRQSGTIVTHYNIYLGIDQVSPWSWAWLLPGVWLAVTLADVALAYAMYRTDAYLAASLIVLACVWSLPWMGTLYHLTLINV